MDAYGSGRTHPAADGYVRDTLTDRAVRMWGTPVARDDQKTPEAHLAMKDRMGGGRTEPTSLTVQAKMWPTPRTTDQYTPDNLRPDGRTQRGTGADLGAVAQVHGRQDPTTGPAGNTGPNKADLNPRFVAALMGVPWDWLNPCTSVETASYQEWLRKHSCNLPTEPD